MGVGVLSPSSCAPLPTGKRFVQNCRNRSGIWFSSGATVKNVCIGEMTGFDSRANHVRVSTFSVTACSAAKSIGQSALRRTKELARLTLSGISHPCLLPNILNMKSDKIFCCNLVSL